MTIVIKAWADGQVVVSLWDGDRCIDTHTCAPEELPSAIGELRYIAGAPCDVVDERKADKLLRAYIKHRGKFSQACDLEAELNEALGE